MRWRRLRKHAAAADVLLVLLLLLRVELCLHRQAVHAGCWLPLEGCQGGWLGLHGLYCSCWPGRRGTMPFACAPWPAIRDSGSRGARLLYWLPLQRAVCIAMSSCHPQLRQQVIAGQEACLRHGQPVKSHVLAWLGRTGRKAQCRRHHSWDAWRRRPATCAHDCTYLLLHAAAVLLDGR